VRSLLKQRLEEDQCGLIWKGQRQSWGELCRRAQLSATRLAPWRGQAVALMSENCPELVEAILACWWAGCTPTCLAPPARLQGQMDYLPQLQAAGAQVGWCAPSLVERMGAPWQALPIAPAEPDQGPEIEAEWAYIQFSSGTTSQPKATFLSRHNLLSNLEAIVSHLPGGRRGHSCCSWLPLYHDMGLIGCLLCALFAPGDVYLMTAAEFARRPGLWLDQIASHRVTITAAPPFALQHLLERDSGQRDLSCLQCFLLGAETIPADLLESFYTRYAAQGLKWQALRPVYGLAEATLAVTFTGPEGASFLQHQGRRLVSLGRPLPGVKLSLDEQSQICLEGPSLSPLLPQPYPTGDQGLMHDGQLYYLSRLKDVLIYRGRNHDPEPIEQLLAPLTCAAVEVEEFLCIVEAPRRGEPPALQQLQQQLNLAPLPIRPVVVEAGWLPRTSSGKLSRYRAREKARDASF
jgi:fatty-acyl-CoA synthase